MFTWSATGEGDQATHLSLRLQDSRFDTLPRECKQWRSEIMMMTTNTTTMIMIVMMMSRGSEKLINSLSLMISSKMMHSVRQN